MTTALTREQQLAEMPATNAHPSVQIFPYVRGYVKASNLNAEMMIMCGAVGVWRCGATNCSWILRRTGLVDQQYVAQSWTTGKEVTFKSLGAVRTWMKTWHKEEAKPKPFQHDAKLNPEFLGAARPVAGEDY